MEARRSRDHSIARRVGTLLREARLRSKLTQEDVAEQVGCVSGYLRQIEAGTKQPGYPLLVRLCRTLQLSADDLLGLKGESPPLLALEENPPTFETTSPEMKRVIRKIRKLEPRELQAISKVIDVLTDHRRKS